MNILPWFFFHGQVFEIVFFADAQIQAAKRKYQNVSGRHNLSNIHTELQDVQRVMVKNIEDVIHRGEALNSN